MLAPGFLRPSNLRKYLQQVVFNVSTGHDHDGVNSKVVAAAYVNPHINIFQIEDLSAGADIADRTLIECPTGYSMTLISAKVISISTTGSIVVDDTNTSAFTLKNGSNTIVTKTFNASTIFPSVGTTADLGTLSSQYKVLAAGDLVKLSITNAAVADTPLLAIELVYSMAKV